MATARKPDEWMPLHIRDYLVDTMHLTRDQHGAYLLLLMAYWIRGEALPGNDNELAAIAKASKSEWAKIKPILAPFFDTSGGQWKQGRIEKELTKARDLTSAKSDAGRKGAENRWQKHGAANGNGMAEPLADGMANGSQKAWQTDAPLPLPRTNRINSFVVGGGVGRKGVEMTTENKLALFQKWLAEKIGPHGWQIVGVAADPENPNYQQALAHCKRVASENGKGWPHAWPAPGAAA